MAIKQLSTKQVVNLSSDPASGTAGEIYYNTSTNSFKYYNGTAWVAFSSGGSSNSFATIDVPNGTDPVADSSTDTLTITESNGIIVTGDSSADSIQISTNATALNTASTIVARDADQSFDITGIDFDTTDTIAAAVGRLSWDDGEGTLRVGLKGGNVNLQLGQEMVAFCYNGTGSTITNGSVVYILSAQGQRPSIALADADLESTSSKVFGVATEDIANGAEGFVATFGIVNKINTEGFTAGQALWLSSTAGQLTNVKPTQPAHSVFIGYCLHVNQSSGRIFVNPQNGYEIEELHNVLISSIADNHILSYDNATSLWKNQGLAAAIQEVDGASSGIDADLLDGQHGSYYLDTSATAQTKAGDLTISGNLTVNGTTTTIDTTTLLVEDKNIEIGVVSTPSDTTADGGGITLRGTTNKTFNWVDSTDSWTSSENIELASGKVFRINGNQVLSANTLGSGVTSSSLTSVGTITSGVWQGTVIAASYIDTDIARLASPTFTGTPAAPTASADTNTTQIATTAFVLGQASSTNPTSLGSVEIGTSTRYARADHVHPTTGLALLSGATFTGTVIAPAATTSISSIRLPHGTDPTAPTNGDIWTTTSGLFARINSATIGPFGQGNQYYQATAPSSPSVGDIWIESDVDISAYSTYQRWTKVLTGSQSVFTGTESGKTLSYPAGLEHVYLNGVLLLRGTDYTGTDGSTITLTSAAQSGDVFEVLSPNTFSVANTYTQGEVDTFIANLIPSQTGNSGKYLTTNGTSTSWGTLDLSLYAPLASPTFTGTPAAPTAAGGTNTTQIATTAFVRGEISALVDSAPSTLDTLNELAAALGDDANFSTTVTNSLAGKQKLIPLQNTAPTSPSSGDLWVDNTDTAKPVLKVYNGSSWITAGSSITADDDQIILASRVFA